MRATFQAHESLRVRWQVAEAPEAGSALACADEAWPRLPFTEHARQALSASWDHLDVIRLVIDAGRTFPTGINGVLRGAIVASALAVWLLGPDNEIDRVERGLAVSDEWYERRIRFQRDMLAMLTESPADGHAQLEMFRDDQTQLKKRRTTRLEVQATSIIDWSAKYAFGKNTPQHKQSLLEWQRLGGDAHALGWQLMTQDVAWEKPPGTLGQQQAHVTGSLSNVSQPYLCAWHMLSVGIRRFDELGTVR